MVIVPAELPPCHPPQKGQRQCGCRCTVPVWTGLAYSSFSEALSFFYLCIMYVFDHTVEKVA